jgi:hypothetical protein
MSDDLYRDENGKFAAAQAIRSTESPPTAEISPPGMMRGFADVMSNAGGPGSSGDESMPEPDWQTMRATGRDGNPGEGAGDHQVLTPGGRAPHGADVPGTGIPSPADDGSSQ